MSDRLKAKIGNELYQKILDLGVKSEEIDLVNDGYIPHSRFNEVNGKVKALNEKISVYEKQLAETKALVSNSEEYKLKYNDLDAKYKTDLASKDAEIVNVTKRFLAENELKNAGAKHIQLLMNQIDLNKVSVENDKLIGMNTFIDNFKKEYSDLFSVKESKSTPSGGDCKNSQTIPNGDFDWDAAVNKLLNN